MSSKMQLAHSELLGWGFEDFTSEDTESVLSDTFWGLAMPVIVISVLLSIPVGLWTIIRWIFT